MISVPESMVTGYLEYAVSLIVGHGEHAGSRDDDWQSIQRVMRKRSLGAVGKEHWVIADIP